MFAQFINGIAVKLASTNTATESIAKKTAVFIYTADGGWGTGVAIARRTVLTAAHNFKSAEPTKSIILSPFSKTRFSVVRAKLDLNLDVGVVTVNHDLPSPHAEVDFESAYEEKGVFVLKSSFDLSSAPNRISQLRSTHLTQEVHKGLVVEPATDLVIDEKGTSRFVSLFHLKSKVGDSGAGIFFMDTGKLATLNCTGNGRNGVSGPAISEFRKFMQS